MPASSGTPVSSPDSDDSVIAEHIPWEQLTVATPPDRTRLWYAIAAVIAVVAIVLMVVRSLDRPTVEPVTTTASPPSVVSMAVPLPPPSTVAPLSEADLLAVDRVAVERTVAATGEWIALEYFSLDPGDDWSERVAAAAGVRPTNVPAGPDPAAVSYVEWVRAASVDEVATGRYEVLVHMRRLVAADGVSYRRLGVETVRMSVSLHEAGGVTLMAPPLLVDGPARVVSEELVATGVQVGAGGISWPGS